MSEFINFQFPIYNMGGVREDVVAPMPTARVVGKWAGTPEGVAVLKRCGPDIVHDVARYRQHYYTGVLPMVRKVIETDDYRMEYVMHEGKELLTIEPRVTPSPLPPLPKEHPDALIVELIWQDTRVVEGIPYWYVYALRNGKFAIVTSTSFEFVCGTSPVIVDGIPFVGGPIVGSTTDQWPGGFSALWANTADEAGRYSAPSNEGNRATELFATGAGPCNATGVVMYTPIFPGPIVTSPWVTPPLYSEYPPDSAAPLSELGRFKGWHEVSPQNLISRYEVVSKFRRGETVGVGWGDTAMETTSGLPYDDAHMRFYDSPGITWYSGPRPDANRPYSPASTKGLEIANALHPVMRRHNTILVDTHWYAQKGGMKAIEIAMHGYWRSPQHKINGTLLLPNYWSAPAQNIDGRLATPPGDNQAAYEAFVAANMDYSAAFYNEVRPGPVPLAVSVVATWVWGTRKLTYPIKDLYLTAGQYTQQSVVLDPVTISSIQLGQNNSSMPPDVLPYGTYIGKLTANFEDLTISLTQE